MKIIAHRGYWGTADQKNTLSAFDRALKNGYGIETDFRDLNTKLVISHDPPAENALTAAEFTTLLNKYSGYGPIAINIKSDGLQNLVKEFADQACAGNHFVFDMSVPDMRAYLQLGIPAYTRLSEYESEPAFLSRSEGIWLDCFENEWYSVDVIQKYLYSGKKICVVSPELHRRPHENLWRLLRQNNLNTHPSISICTDFPAKADEYFNEKN